MRHHISLDGDLLFLVHVAGADLARARPADLLVERSATKGQSPRLSANEAVIETTNLNHCSS